MTYARTTVVMTIAVLTVNAFLSAAENLVVLPATVKLTGPAARQTLLVELADGELALESVRDGIQWKSADESIAKVEHGIVVPVGNGTTTITASAKGKTAQIPVTIEQADHAQQWSFRNQVQSVLSKTGCNSGACHGAAAGKNGFKLSLRGYDPEGDYYAITRQSRGRRVVSDDPGRSLILTKPTTAIPHKGGLRFSENSLEYQVIAEWIAQGQSAPSESDARIQRLEILPAAARRTPGTKQQMVVMAHFSDGHTEDVTRWSKYTSTNLAVCSVDDQGAVDISGSGEASVVAWYLAQNVTATITVPYQNAVSPVVFQNAPRANFIDDLVLEKLAALKMPPSPRADDSELLRRIYLDTIGVLPTVDEVKGFLADQEPSKREKLIDSLLSRTEFVDYWSYQWSDLLLVTGKRLRPEAIKSYYKWIRERVAENVSWAEFAKGIILATGSTAENGAANFYALHQDPQDMVETTSMAFMGMSIQCAHCHDHPNEKWTNDDYYGMVSLFAHVRGKGWGGEASAGDGNRTIFLVDRGEVLQPRTAQPQLPKPLDGKPMSFEDTRDRREYLAEWLVSPKNPYFAKAIVNRIWANFMGRGLVEAVDDLRQTNPASNEKLLRRLADELVRNDFDLKSLMRTILKSETYQRSHMSLTENVPDQRFHSHVQPRRLKAEVLLDAFSQVTGVPTAFKDQPSNTRAIQLPDASVASYFLDAFGRPERILTCSCERSDEPSMTQVLHLTNGKTIQEKLEAKEGRISAMLDGKLSENEIVETLFLAALSRYPSDAERTRLSGVLAETPAEEKRVAVEDLFWSVLTSKEFLLQH